MLSCIEYYESYCIEYYEYYACYSTYTCVLRKSVRYEGGDRTMLGGDRGTRGVP